MASSSLSVLSPALASLSSCAPVPARNPRAGGRNLGQVCCQASSSSSSSRTEEQEEKWRASRRDVVAGSIFLGMSAGLGALPAMALLETDDDESLLEKVKEDRKKRLEKRGAVTSFKDEAESIQKAVYELSKAGQAIEGENYGLASSVLGSGEDGWVKEVKDAIEKVNQNAEEEVEAANFSSGIAALIPAVGSKDLELSKSAFVASANALEKWASLTGLVDQIKGL